VNNGNDSVCRDVAALDSPCPVSSTPNLPSNGGVLTLATPGAEPTQAAIASFFASLAHDLRSPLGVVSEALSELRADFAGQLTDEHRLLVTLAERGLLRLGRIADTVSLTSALETGTLELRRHRLDLIELLRAAAGTAATLEPRREVQLGCELPEGSCHIVADGDKLKRAIVEILINAVRFARRRALLTLELHPDEACITIEDDGQGVPVDRRAALFQRFTPRASRTGLGVGLSNAHEVIAAHGGRLALEQSTLPPGRPGTLGARFVLSLAIGGGP